MLDGLARIKTTGGVEITLARLGTRPHVALTVQWGRHMSNLILDADDVDALADAFKVLSDELADRVRPGD
jgi:hypothetical protein